MNSSGPGLKLFPLLGLTPHQTFLVQRYCLFWTTYTSSITRPTHVQPSLMPLPLHIWLPEFTLQPPTPTPSLCLLRSYHPLTLLHLIEASSKNSHHTPPLHAHKHDWAWTPIAIPFIIHPHHSPFHGNHPFFRINQIDILPYLPPIIHHGILLHLHSDSPWNIP